MITLTAAGLLAHAPNLLAGPELVGVAARPGILSASPERTAELLGGSGRSRLVWELLRRGEDPFGSDLLGKKARERLHDAFGPFSGTLEDAAPLASPCGTRKALLRLADGHLIETVCAATVSLWPSRSLPSRSSP